MTEKKRKTLYWVFKVSSILVSCGLPVYAVFEHFPVWTEKQGTGYSVGAGGIIILVVLLLVFRKTVFDFVRDRFNLQHAPPLVAWIVALIISYTLIYVSKFLKDLTAVCWMGLLGCAIGMVLTFVAENYFREKKEEVKKVDG